MEESKKRKTEGKMSSDDDAMDILNLEFSEDGNSQDEDEYEDVAGSVHESNEGALEAGGGDDDDDDELISPRASYIETSSSDNGMGEGIGNVPPIEDSSNSRSFNLILEPGEIENKKKKIDDKRFKKKRKKDSVGGDDLGDLFGSCENMVTEMEGEVAKMKKLAVIQKLDASYASLRSDGKSRSMNKDERFASFASKEALEAEEAKEALERLQSEKKRNDRSKVKGNDVEVEVCRGATNNNNNNNNNNKKRKMVNNNNKKKNEPKKGRGRNKKKKVQRDLYLFPDVGDELGLTARTHSIAYNLICNQQLSSEEGSRKRAELSQEYRDRVAKEALEIGNTFGSRLETVKNRAMDAIKSIISANGKIKGQDATKLVAVLEATRRYRRLVIPGGAASHKPDATCPWTLSPIDHSNCVRMVFVPDEPVVKEKLDKKKKKKKKTTTKRMKVDTENSDSSNNNNNNNNNNSVVEGIVVGPIQFYCNPLVAKWIRVLHTFCHFEAYLKVELERRVKKAIDTLEEGVQPEPDVIWRALFDEKVQQGRGGAPKGKKERQKPGTNLIELKKRLLVDICNTVRIFAGDNPFKN